MRDSNEQLAVSSAAARTIRARGASTRESVTPRRTRPIGRESARMAPLSEAKQLETLLELQRDLALEANVEKVLLRITLAATFMLDADRATLYVLGEGRTEIWSRALTEGGERGRGVRAGNQLRLPLD